MCTFYPYENGDLKAIFTSTGRIVPFDSGSETVFKFEYNLQDHLGNTRVGFSGHSNGQPEVMQVTDYYPFGLVMNQQDYFANGVLSNKYLYNNKELQDDELAGNSLGWYDYGFRFYDATLARFTTIDPLTEKNHSQSGFAYAYNNPVRFIDYMGLDTIGINYNDKGIWEITNSQIVEGNDVFRVTRDGETTMHTFSEGEYGARINVLNLENNEDYTLGIYHISGAKGEGSVGYAVTPGGAPSTSEESGQRLPDDVYTITPTYSHEKYWIQPLIAVGEKNGNVSGRGVKFHPAPSSLFETRVRQWTDGCYVVSTDYSVRGGQIYYNSNNSLITSKQFNTFLGATNHYDRVGKKSYPGSDFQNGIIFKLIQKSGF